MKLSYELIVTDKDGKVIDRRGGESRSWLIAWLTMVYGFFRGSPQTINCTISRTKEVENIISTRPANKICTLSFG